MFVYFMAKFWTTLNGGPAGRAGWRAVFPITKHTFLEGRRAKRTEQRCTRDEHGFGYKSWGFARFLMDLDWTWIS